MGETWKPDVFEIENGGEEMIEEEKEGANDGRHALHVGDIAELRRALRDHKEETTVHIALAEKTEQRDELMRVHEVRRVHIQTVEHLRQARSKAFVVAAIGETPNRRLQSQFAFFAHMLAESLQHELRNGRDKTAARHGAIGSRLHQNTLRDRVVAVAETHFGREGLQSIETSTDYAHATAQHICRSAWEASSEAYIPRACSNCGETA